MALLLAASSCSCEPAAIQWQSPRVDFRLEADPSNQADYLVDFGLVAVGELSTRTFILENEGNADLTIVSGTLEPPFAIDLPTSRIPVGGDAELRFTFQPKEETSAPIEQIVLLSTNEDQGRSYTVRVLGEAARASLSCEPASIHLGPIPLGQQGASVATCTNLLPVPLEIQLQGFKGPHAGNFSASATEGDGGSIQVPGNGAVSIAIDFRANTLGRNDTFLELRDAHDLSLAKIPIEAMVVESGLVVDPPSCLDFSYVALGATRRGTLLLKNVGPREVRVVGVSIAGGASGQYSVVTPPPLTLARDGGLAELELDFHPALLGPSQVQITVETEEEGGAPAAVSACATGFGGGPTLTCTPGGRDFGLVAIGMPATSLLHCLNTGAAPVGIRVDPLQVEAIAVDSERFAVTLLNPDETTGPKPRGYAIGEGFHLQLSYEPITETFDEGLIVLHTNVSPVSLPVSGQGRALPPCEVSVAPQQLRFGVVDRGAERILPFEIRNLLSSPCLIRDLELAEGSDPAFSLESIDHLELAGDASALIPVRYAPLSYGSNAVGKVRFEVSKPTDRYREIQLRGDSTPPCLRLDPMEIDFGSVLPGCGPLNRQVTISNVCSDPVTITSIDVEETMPRGTFDLSRRPVLPAVLNPQGYTELQVGFSPTEMGDHQATLRIGLDPTSSLEDHSYSMRVRGEGGETTWQRDEFEPLGPAKVDVLFVIDNSTSMYPYQVRLQENLPAFLGFIGEQDVDFQIGVTTTGLTPGFAWPYPSCPGGADGGEDGRLFPIDGSHPRILTPETPDLEEHWRHNVTVGQCQITNESALEGAFRALSHPLISEKKDSRYQSAYPDGNLGFLRQDASLSIILMSDATDFSPQLTSKYVDFFLGLKHGARDRVRVHGITNPRYGAPIVEWDPCPLRTPGDRMIDVVEALGGTWMSICTPTKNHDAWAGIMRSLSKAAFAFDERLMLRGLPADVNGDGRVSEADIQLLVDGAPLLPLRDGSVRVWHYDPISNSINFSPLYAPRSDTPIVAAYELSCAGG